MAIRPAITSNFAHQKSVRRFFAKSIACRRADARRRLHTARIDVKLRREDADVVPRRPMSSEVKKRKVDPARDRTWNLRFRRPAPYPLGHRTLCRRKLSSCVRGEIALDFMRSSGKLKILTRTRRVDFWSAKFDVIAGLIAYFNLCESHAFQSQQGPVPFACGEHSR